MINVNYFQININVLLKASIIYGDDGFPYQGSYTNGLFSMSHLTK